MITFKDEQEFEDAVMKVLRERLQVNVEVHNQTIGYYDGSGKKVRVQLDDVATGIPISYGEDCS